MEAIDCQGFAGGFTMGTVQAGFTLVGKRELPGGFGVANCEANRHLLGDAWRSEVSPWQDWTPIDVPYVFGNPPCSGFSLMSASSFRGIDSPVNSCMFAFVEYAARCKPQIAIFESVQQAYTQGRPLMQNLRAVMEARTGESWALTHVLHNAIAVGGAAIRRRYFMVLHRIPFGVEPLDPPVLPDLEDAIGDLRGMPLQWEDQHYAVPHKDASWWARDHRRADGFVDGHWTRLNSPNIQRARELTIHADPVRGVEWKPGMTISQAAQAYYEKNGTLPELWTKWHPVQKWIDNDWHMGFHQLCRWHPDRHARVITGGGSQLVLNPWEFRPLTLRECARIQGFPDEWRIAPLATNSQAPALWGKGIPVQCGRWISTWARESISGWPGWDSGDEIGDREFLIDHTNAVPYDYRSVVGRAAAEHV